MGRVKQHPFRGSRRNFRFGTEADTPRFLLGFHSVVKYSLPTMSTNGPTKAASNHSLHSVGLG